MRESHKSKRVSWASDVNLCQVRLFLSEESPSQVGLDSQDHLQAKTSWLSHSTGTGSDDVLPPGFEGSHPANLLQTKLSQIPTIKWRCPPRFVLDLTWQVVAGDESEEAGIQNQREMRVLEAVYPRPSAIPPNPSGMLNVEDSRYDDGQTPSIPITPIEDEDVATDTSSEPMAQYDLPISSQSLQQPIGVPSSSQHSAMNMANLPVPERQAAGTALSAEPGFLAAALTELANNNERGNLIDHELLIKILSNPKMVEKLVTDYGATTTNNTQNTTTSRSPSVAISEPPPAQVIRTPSSIPMSAAVSNGPLYPQPNGAAMGHLPNSRVPPPPSISVPCPPSHVAAPPKDMSYYKSLIQQHGGERQEALSQYGNRYCHQPVPNQEPVNGHKPRESKPKIMKPCIYFNSSRGCRHGANCAYQHDASFQQRGSSVPEMQSAKRPKFDREISS
ncbi:Zinc finger CCCH domain-containing protein 6 [Morus notabilis]|uniref:Zinc finger CCCH domain-containing protein 6 n=1 Tax=Morus notabilis TaxID=981085 RepID=W9RQS9_9ROSA|nr:zinc finger CCCH domain-containing protein 6 [Morus notabilis]EXC04196.1 Zinc finger CCCH domain-containing protein 6 [Morus notabilis]